MTIRFAIDGIPALVALGRRMHLTTRFRRFDYDELRVARSLERMFADPSGRHVCFVAENAGGHVVGALLAVLERQIFSERCVASVMHYDVLPECRMGGYGLRLMRAFERWAQNRRVHEIAFGINSGDPGGRVGAFARRIGFVAVGENFVKEMG